MIERLRRVSTVSTGKRVAFGAYVLDVGKAELTRDGTAVKLAPQPFTALTLLVERAGDLVTREELRRALWGDDNFVDFNAGVNFCIAQLRTTLEDPASRSAYIAAVPRRGYRFVAEVRNVAITSTPSIASTSPVRLQAFAWASATTLLVAFAIATIQPDPTREVRSLAAVESFERARLDLFDAGPIELKDRVRYFEKAIAADPSFAAAYAGLADTKLMLGAYRVEPPTDAFAAAKAAAARALQLDDRVAEAHASYGAAVWFLEWDWTEAGRHLERAIGLDPTSTRVRYWYSQYLSALGRHDAAIAQARRAVLSRPNSPSSHTALGLAAYYARRFTDAIAACEDAVGLMREFEPARRCTAAAAAEVGDFDRAARHIVRLIATASDTRTESAVRAGGDVRAFWSARAERLLSQVTSETCECGAVAIAAALAHAGRTEDALGWLERAANRQTDTLLFAAVHPGLAALRSEPRFQRILQRVRWPGLDPVFRISAEP